ACGGGVSRLCEPLLERAFGAVARGERSRGRGERLRASDPARELACTGPIQWAPDRESSAHDGIRRQHTPRPAVELDDHPTALPLAEAGDDRGHASASADANASAATSALPFDAADSSAATGSRRADATWSAPSSTWIAWRLCCVTSGCSRRKADEFWRPCPSRSSPKLKYEPDFVTTFRSSPESSTVPSHEMPEP